MTMALYALERGLVERCGKYGSWWDGWCSNEIIGLYGVGWKIIRKGLGSSLVILDLRWEMLQD
jgi:hypothetical protein